MGENVGTQVFNKLERFPYEEKLQYLWHVDLESQTKEGMIKVVRMWGKG